MCTPWDYESYRHMVPRPVSDDSAIANGTCARAGGPYELCALEDGERGGEGHLGRREHV